MSDFDDPTPQALRAAPRLTLAATRWRRVLLWTSLVGLLLVAQSLLVWLTWSYESARAQEQVEEKAVLAAAELRQNLGRDLQSLQALLWNDPTMPQWRGSVGDLLHQRRAIQRIELRSPDLRVREAIDTPFHAPLFNRLARIDMSVDVELACAAARRLSGPAYSRSYFVPLGQGDGLEVMDVCIPLGGGDALGEGYLTATLGLSGLLADVTVPGLLQTHELTLIEGDGTRLARVGLVRGAGVYRSERLVDLPGATLQLRLDSAVGGPRLIPNLSVALVLGLSLALSAVVLLLARDVRRRARAERALAEALTLRRAMEDSLVTGLRARDMNGRITYVNPAFCRMVGWPAEALLGRSDPPYWPPELAEEYLRRQPARLVGVRDGNESREGFETTFVRANGERFAVLIFEAPLVEASGRQTGWMSSVLDISERRGMEETSRQQQERMQASARLATIASYATGSLNLMREGTPDADTMGMIQQAAQRIAEQAERAGRVIKSVHDFVRRREQPREVLRADVLIDSVMPLVRLQSRKSGTRVEIDLPSPIPHVVCDRTMVEQVLLNLTRNGIQAMEDVPADRRVLRVQVSLAQGRWVQIAVVDQGDGIAPEVGARLFTPFFTTRAEGMGLGLSLCRTVIEQHGGALDFENLPARGDGPDPQPRRTVFRFTLPAHVQRSA
jgi:two-component system sensor histidine kinase DctS